MKSSLLAAPIAVALALALFASGCGDDAAAGSGTGGGAATSGGDGGDAPQTSTASSSPSTGASPTGTSSGVSNGSSASSGDVASSSASTGAGPLECTGAAPSFAADVQPILTHSCAVTNCHKGTHPDKNLDLSDGAAWAEIVGVETEECSGDKVRVTASDPAMSYLVHKIRGEELCGTSRRMPPPNRDPLEAVEIQTIVDWVCTGALDN